MIKPRFNARVPWPFLGQLDSAVELSGALAWLTWLFMKMDFATGVCDGKIGVVRTGAAMSQNAGEQFKQNSNKQETYSKAPFFPLEKNRNVQNFYILYVK